MKVTTPASDRVRQLHRPVCPQVPADCQDPNGHVDVRHRLGMYHLTNGSVMELPGISEGCVHAGRVGIFDIEHDTWYLSELHAGEEVAPLGAVSRGRSVAPRCPHRGASGPGVAGAAHRGDRPLIGCGMSGRHQCSIESHCRTP